MKQKLLEDLGLIIGGLINLKQHITFNPDHIEVMVDPETGKPIKDEKK